MRKSSSLYAASLAMLLLTDKPQLTLADRPYKDLKVVEVGGDGTFDTAFADVEGRRLYIETRRSPDRYPE